MSRIHHFITNRNKYFGIVSANRVANTIETSLEEMRLNMCG